MICFCPAVPAFIVLIFYMFIVMNQYNRSNSLYVKTCLAINLILIFINALFSYWPWKLYSIHENAKEISLLFFASRPRQTRSWSKTTILRLVKSGLHHPRKAKDSLKHNFNLLNLYSICENTKKGDFIAFFTSRPHWTRSRLNGFGLSLE